MLEAHLPSWITKTQIFVNISIKDGLVYEIPYFGWVFMFFQFDMCWPTASLIGFVMCCCRISSSASRPKTWCPTPGPLAACCATGTCWALQAAQWLVVRKWNRWKTLVLKNMLKSGLEFEGTLIGTGFCQRMQRITLCAIGYSLECPLLFSQRSPFESLSQPIWIDHSIYVAPGPYMAIL